MNLGLRLAQLPRAYLPAAIIIVAGVALSVSAWQVETDRVETKAQEEFERSVNKQTQVLEQSIQRELFVLESLRAFYAASNLVDRAEFTEFTKPFLSHSPGIISLSWLPRVLGPERDAYELATRAEGFEDFQILLDDSRRKAPQRESYFPLHYSTSRHETVSDLGLDLSGDLAVNLAINRSRDSGDLTVCVPEIDHSGGLGNTCSSYLAIYKNALPNESLAEKRKNLHGVLRLVVDLDMVINSLDSLQEADIELQLMGSLASTQFANRAKQTSKAWEKFTSITVGNQALTVRATANGSAMGESNSPGVVLTVGLILTSLLTALLSTLIGRSQSIRILAESRTTALFASEARSKAILDSAQAGILSIDANGIIDAVNFSAEFIFGYATDELIGERVSMLLPSPHAEEYETFLRDLKTNKNEKAFSRSYELLGQRRDKSTFPMELSTREIKGLDKKFYSLMCLDISERNATLSRIKRLFTAIEHVEEAILITDSKGSIEYVNPAFEKITGYSVEESIGKNPRILKSGKHDREFYKNLWGTLWRGETWSGQMTNRRKDGTLYEEMQTISPIVNEQGKISNFVAVKHDVSQQLQMEMQLVQAQKLESVGQLAAGIAHEINTPIQYVGDNTRFLRESFQELVPVFAKLDSAFEAIKTFAATSPDLAELPDLITAADLSYLQEEIPRAIDESLQGIDRVAKIVRAMKEFSHPGSKEMTPTNLKQAIESTITVATNEWKYVAEVSTDFDEDLPPVTCLPDEFNQVILNIIINAAHAIADKSGATPDTKGSIHISTSQQEDWAEVRIADSGSGIPEAARAKIFDPFFTTKEVGKGTGQGLAIAHDVIVNKHGGSLDFESVSGEGTTFILRLPLVRLGEEEEATA